MLAATNRVRYQPETMGLPRSLPSRAAAAAAAAAAATVIIHAAAYFRAESVAAAAGKGIAKLKILGSQVLIAYALGKGHWYKIGYIAENFGEFPAAAAAAAAAELVARGQEY